MLIWKKNKNIGLSYVTLQVASGRPSKATRAEGVLMAGIFTTTSSRVAATMNVICENGIVRFWIVLVVPPAEMTFHKLSWTYRKWKNVRMLQCEVSPLTTSSNVVRFSRFFGTQCIWMASSVSRQCKVLIVSLLHVPFTGRTNPSYFRKAHGQIGIYL